MAQLRLAIATPRWWALVGDEAAHLLGLAESLNSAGHRITAVSALWKRPWPRQMSLKSVPLVRLRGAPRGGWSTLRWIYSFSNWLGEPAAGELDGLLVAGL